MVEPAAGVGDTQFIGRELDHRRTTLGNRRHCGVCIFDVLYELPGDRVRAVPFIGHETFYKPVDPHHRQALLVRRIRRPIPRAAVVLLAKLVVCHEPSVSLHEPAFHLGLELTDVLLGSQYLLADLFPGVLLLIV